MVSYQQLEAQAHASARSIRVRFRLFNESDTTWRAADTVLGWQVYDPETGTFIFEGEWNTLGDDLAPAEGRDVEVVITLPPERGRYHAYLSLNTAQGWFYQSGHSFVLLDAVVEHAHARLLGASVTTLAALRRRSRRRTVKRLLSEPVKAIWTNRSLIRSMVRRDILARYRGSFGDVLWTILHPLLLTLTYFFVFGIILRTRFGPDQSRTEFVLYFLAGMLPWLAFSEAIGRSPHVMIEHRNFVKKLLFPVEILPVTLTIAGLVTQAFATGVFLLALLILRGSLPLSVLWLPAILIPQILFTAGAAWFLSALGVYLRDLGQVIGLLLTLWFFLTPICYPEASLPPEAAPILKQNPIYAIVRGYRTIFLEGSLPHMASLFKLWVLGVSVFLLGHAWFYKLRKSFADVI